MEADECLVLARKKNMWPMQMFFCLNAAWLNVSVVRALQKDKESRFIFFDPMLRSSSR